MTAAGNPQPPPVFKSIGERDVWQWNHLGSPDLLTSEDQERLLRLPPTGASAADWAGYLATVAKDMAAANRCSHAYAYWRACLEELARSPGADGKACDDAVAGFLGSSIGAAGAPFAFDGQSPDEIARVALLGGSLPARDAVVRSLIVLSAIDDSLVARVKMSNQLVGRTSEALFEILPSCRHALEREPTGRLKRAAREFSQREQKLRLVCEAVARQPTLEEVERKRSDLLAALRTMTDFTPQSERPLVDALLGFLAREVAAYARLKGDATRDDYAECIERSDELVEQSVADGSYFAATIATPLSYGLRFAVSRHYQASSLSHSANLSARVLKPIALGTGHFGTLDLLVQNTGTAPAEDVVLRIDNVGGERIDLTSSEEFVGLVPSSTSREVALRVEQLSAATADVRVTLEFRDRAGNRQWQRDLKVSLQRDVDWPRLEQAANPYSIQSVSEPSKLKGRDELLRRLKAGFASSNSFMITGQRRVGKTSLAKVLLRDLKTNEDVLPLYVTLGELDVNDDDPGRLGYGLVRRLLEEYPLRFNKPVGVSLPPPQEFVGQYASSLTRVVRRFRQIHPKVRIAFALDDFDELPPHLFTGETGVTLFLAFRTLINDGISFFFIGSEKLPAILSEQAERLNQVKPLQVDYLPPDALRRLVSEPVGGVLEWDDEAVSDVGRWSAGNPYFATLLCSEVWDQAVANRDYYIVPSDVTDAVARIVQTESEGSFKHFWSDSGVGSEEQRRLVAQRNDAVIRAVARMQPNPFGYVERGPVAAECRSLLTGDEVNAQVEELLVRKVLEHEANHPMLVRFRVPLFARWLSPRSELPLSYAEQKALALVVTSGDLTSEEAQEAAHGLSYRGSKITTDDIRGWAAQFGAPADQRLMLKLLQGVRRGLFDQARLTSSLEETHRRVLAKAADAGFEALRESTRSRPHNVYVTSGEGHAKSGSHLLYPYRIYNKLLEDHSGPVEAVFETMKMSDVPSIVICVDDFIGSGKSAVEAIQTSLLPRWRRRPAGHRCLLVYAVVLGYERGVDFIEAQMGDSVKVVCLHVLGEAQRAFHRENDLFGSVEDLQKAKAIAQRVGAELGRDALGFENSEALVVFPDRVPNNTLPILWKDGTYNGRTWKPLFPRF